MISGENMKVLLATKNEHKIKELQEIINQYKIGIELISLDTLNDFDEVIEDGKTFYDNAFIKAKYYYNKYHLPCLADDSGLCVDSLNGLPGIYSARFASDINHHATSALNRKKLLKMLEKEEERKAHFSCALVYYDGQMTLFSYGELSGFITKEEKGENGFGYDSIFYVPEYQKTLAEMDENEKNKISHRYIASVIMMEKLKEVL